jgi:hypothetical protein
MLIDLLSKNTVGRRAAADIAHANKQDGIGGHRSAVSVWVSNACQSKKKPI